MGAKSFDIKRATVFCLGHCLSKAQIDKICPLATPMHFESAHVYVAADKKIDFAVFTASSVQIKLYVLYVSENIFSLLQYKDNVS